MDSLIFELQIVFYFQFFLSANVRHNLARLAMLTFLFFCVFYFHILHMIGLHVSLGDTVSINIAQ